LTHQPIACTAVLASVSISRNDVESLLDPSPVIDMMELKSPKVYCVDKSIFAVLLRFARNGTGRGVQCNADRS
jgi:hypothetical protein